MKKSVRFQLSDGSAGTVDELAALQKESRELEHQQNALKTERTNWLNSAEVKEIEAKRKSLGLFSAEQRSLRPVKNTRCTLQSGRTLTSVVQSLKTESVK